MLTKKGSALMRQTAARDPFALLREMTSEFDRMFQEWPAFRGRAVIDASNWSPEIDVFEKDNRLVTKVDLPGMKKEDVKVEITDGHLAISGERKSQAEENKEHYYKSEREYGSFYRAVPLPEGVKLEDVKATFADGVLEVSIPLPAQPAANVQTVEIQGPAKAVKTAA